MPRRSALVGVVALALIAPAPPGSAARGGPAAGPAADFTVFAFSQSDVHDEDPQVYQLDPDINIRAIGKWSTSGDEAADYNFAQIGRYRAQGIAFMGSGTASVIFPHDFASAEIFDDMSTRDADNNPVPHDEFGFPDPARRGNIFNPKYRQYLLGWAGTPTRSTPPTRRILISSNGLWPYVDFNSVGMYPWNPDEQTPDFRGADYVPVVDGHLNGAKSLRANYRYLKERSAEIAGDVPVVFIDWPNDMMTNYLNLPLSEKKDYWRIFGAEAYANGLFPAFHLKDTVGSPTAEQYGMLEFFQTYTRFYKDHRALFRSNRYAREAVRVSAPRVEASLLVQRGTGARTLHLVNHNYDQGIVPQREVRVEVDLRSCPRRVGMVSPDFTGGKVPATRCRGGNLTVTLDRLDYYTVLTFS